MENNIDILEINRTLQESFIHYDPERVDYTINNIELELLQSSGNSIWKDVFLATLGLGFPSLINGFCLISNLKKNDVAGLDIFLNFLIAGIAFSMCIICFIVWQQNAKSFNKIIEQIKNKPKYKLPNK